MFSHRTRPTPRPHRIGAGLERLEARETPAVIALDDFYRVPGGQVLTVPATRGVLANDFSDTNFGAVLRVTAVSPPTLTDKGGGTDFSRELATPLPPNTVTLNPDGSFTVVAPSNLPPTVLRLGFSYQVSNALDPTEPVATGFVRVYLTGPRQERIAVGADVGSRPLVNVYDKNNTLVQSFEAYESSFTGGVRVATADLNLDGIDDVVTAPGVGGSARVKVFDGASGRVIYDNIQFEFSFTGGAYVATGDVNGDSFDDLIIGAGAGGGPRIQVINGQSFFFAPTDSPFTPTAPTFDRDTGIVNNTQVIEDFFAYEQSFTGGVKVAAGDLDGVGRDIIVTAPGLGGGPVVKTFDYNNVVGPPSILAGGLQVVQPLNQVGLNFGGSAVPNLSFLAGDASGRSGVNISTADTDGDGRADIVTGSTAGASVVSIFDGRSGGLVLQFGVPFEANPTTNIVTGSLTGPTGILISPTTAPNSLVPSQPNPVTVTTGNNLSLITNGLPIASGGVTVLGIDVDGDGADEIVTGAGPGNAARVNVFKPNGTRVSGFLAFPANVLSGINVG